MLKSFRKLMLSLTLFTMPSMANDLPLEITPTLSTHEAQIEQNAERRRDSGHSERFNQRRHRMRALRLSDFDGPWVISIDTIGGVAGQTAVGISATADGQIVFDKKGNGIANFLEAAIYNGTPGSLISVNATGATFKLSLIDPTNGIGTIAISNPAIGLSDTFNFVAIRSKVDGQPIRLEGHPITDRANRLDVSSFILERQFQ